MFFFSQHLGSFGPMKYKVGIMVFKSIFLLFVWLFLVTEVLFYLVLGNASSL